MALFPLNASILLEAKKKNVNKKIKVNPDDSDYEAMAEEDEDTGIETTEDEDTSDTSVDDEEGEDYASYSEEDDSIEPSSEENEEEDTDATNYSETDEDESSTSDDIDSDDDSSNNSDEDTDVTDYSDDSDVDDNSSDDMDSSDDETDYSSDESTDTNSSSETEDINSTDAEKNKLLIDDFLNLYYFTRTILDKLSTFDKGDILANSVVTQVAKNITLLQSKLYDYIVNNFSEKYIRNLYQYNFFIQGIKINIEMLKKIKDFNVN